MEIKKYIRFLCDLLVIDQPRVFIKESGQFKDIDDQPAEPFTLKGSAAATTIVEETEIYIDMDVINKDMIYPILSHEIRHVYQYQAVMQPSWGEPMAETWKEEIMHYSASNIKGYENQSIEIDANAFSKLIINVVFKKDFEVNCNQELLKKRIQELMNDFSYEEIKECYEYNIGPFPNIQA